MNTDPRPETPQLIPTPAKHRIFVVDDHPIVQQALTEMLNHEPDLEVCGSTKDARKALELVERLQPELVILDLVLAGANGIDLLKDIRVRHPKQLVLMLSMHDESVYALRACRAGAAGYIMKAEATEKLLVAIRQILAGGVYVSERIQKRVLDRMHSISEPESSHPLDQLSDRELEVLRLIGHGRSTRDIANQLHLSVKTIESHRAHLKEKLRLKTSSELVQYALRLQEEHFGTGSEGETAPSSGPPQRLAGAPTA